MIEVKAVDEKLFGLYVNNQLIGTSRLQCDADLAAKIIGRACARYSSIELAEFKDEAEPVAS